MKGFILKIVISFPLFCFSQTLSPYWNIKQNTNFPWTGAVIRYMSVPNAKTVWAVGYDNYNLNRTYNYFSTSKDGGLTYTVGTVFADTLDYGLSCIFAHDSLDAWISAYRKPTSSKTCDVIYHTTDGGVTWNNGGNSGMFNSGSSFANFITFISPSVGVAVGDPVSGDFEIYRTTNGGVNWSAVAATSIPNALTNEFGIANVCASYGNSIWFGTDNGRIFRSSDGGQTWAVSTVTAASIYGVLNISFVDNNNGLALIYTGGNYSLHKSTDGGATWNVVSPLPIFLGLDDIANVPGTNIFVSCGGNVTANYLISYSTDLGLTWQSNWGGSLIRYFEMAFADNTTGYAGGQQSTMTYSLDGIYKFSGAPLAINDNTSFSDLKLYPNPSNGIVTLKIPSAKNGLSISIRNLLGEELLSEKIGLRGSVEDYILDLRHLLKGLYTIVLDKDGQKSVQKIVIE